MSSSSWSGTERRRAWWLPVTVAPCALLLGGCGGEELQESRAELSAVSNSGAEPVVLEVDAFSGRENPTWPLTEVEARGLRTVLESLPSTEHCPSPPRDNLGFRGFTVTGLEMSGTAAEKFSVEGDCVRLEGFYEGRSQLLDEHRKAHAFLADVAADRDPSMRKIIASG